MHHTRWTLSLLVLLGCARQAPATSSTAQALLTACTNPCIRPEEYGAVANDGHDDRVALQSAIDAAVAGPKCLELRSGTYHAERQRRIGKPGQPSLVINGQLELFGTGKDTTTIAMLGPGTCAPLAIVGAPTPEETATAVAIGCASFPGPTDWRLIDIVGDNVYLHDLGLDGSERTSSEEQTHLLQINGPSANTIIERVKVRYDEKSGPGFEDLGGDCIRLLGTPTEWVVNTVLRDIDAPECDRSGAGIQRATRKLLIQRFKTGIVRNQAVDFEPTGAPGFCPQPGEPCDVAIVEDVVIEDSDLGRGPDSNGAFTVSVVGDGYAFTQGIVIRRTVIRDGGIHVMNVRDALFEDLDLNNVPTRNEATFHARKRIEGLRIQNSRLERVAGSPNGQVLLVQQHGNISPTDVWLENVTIVQNTNALPINLESLAAFGARNLTVDYRGTTAVFGVTDRGIDQAAGSPFIADSRFLGPLAGTVRMAGLFTGPPVLVRVTTAAAP